MTLGNEKIRLHAPAIDPADGRVRVAGIDARFYHEHYGHFPFRDMRRIEIAETVMAGRTHYTTTSAGMSPDKWPEHCVAAACGGASPVTRLFAVAMSVIDEANSRICACFSGKQTTASAAVYQPRGFSPLSVSYAWVDLPSATIALRLRYSATSDLGMHWDATTLATICECVKRLESIAANGRMWDRPGTVAGSGGSAVTVRVKVRMVDIGLPVGEQEDHSGIRSVFSALLASGAVAASIDRRWKLNLWTGEQQRLPRTDLIFGREQSDEEADGIAALLARV